eukprot:scaffold1381_cov64-Cylindrotheca_fusiformis.AAC.2
MPFDVAFFKDNALMTLQFSSTVLADGLESIFLFSLSASWIVPCEFVSVFHTEETLGLFRVSTALSSSWGNLVLNSKI